MEKAFKVLILGKGKIGEAIAYYLKKVKTVEKITFFDKGKNVKDFDILIGALPSEVGDKGLKMALKYKKDLIDISDVSTSFYLKNKKEILKKGIRVIPGCGISPGLVNLISGHGSVFFDKIDNIEIGAGTLCGEKKFFFPATWCFEDLIEEHFYGATIVRNGKKIKLPPFAGYKTNNLKGVGDFESYFAQEWSSLFYTLKVKNISFRVIRPVGFFHFFQFFKNYGFLERKNLAFAKKIITKKKKDNLTLAYVKIAGIRKRKKRESFWQVSSFSKATEKMNSMQKITALVSVVIFKLLSENEIKNKGLIFLENLARDKSLFKKIVKELRGDEIKISSSTLRFS